MDTGAVELMQQALLGTAGSIPGMAGAKEAFEMTLYEEFVVEKVKKGETIIGLYPCTKVEHKVEFEKWKKQKI